MTTPMKALFATLATGVMAVSAAAPAMAQHGYEHGRGWNNGGNSRQAVNRCTRVAERSASRQGYGRANVSDIRDVRDTRWGYEVRGRIDVRGGHRDGYRDGYRDNYRDGYRSNYGEHQRGWNGYGRGRDTGSFTCRFERGRVTMLDIDGIRGL